jgi:large subunit ribosomal protein L22
MAISIKKPITTDKIKVVSDAKKTAVVKKTAPVSAAPVKVVKSAPVKDTINTAKYINKNLKISPRKLRLLVADVKKMTPATVLSRLKFTNSNAARLLAKCLEDAIASAKYNYKFLPDSLKFYDFRVDEGMKIKRMDKSHGSRFARGVIQKRHSRLVITLSGTIAS